MARLFLWVKEGKNMSTQTDKIAELIAPTLDDMGYEIVRIKMIQNGDDQTLQIMAERSSDGMLNLDDCTDISQAVSAILDVEDPIIGAYDLEISSPGIDRPLTRLKDFTNYAGLEAKISLEYPNENGQKNFRGTLVTAEGDDIRILTDNGEETISFSDIAQAKLVMTDALLKSAEQ